MAIISIPILGRASGRFADAEFLTVAGRNILRSKKLKRYKARNTTNNYYQQLLKLIVINSSPLNIFLSQSYKSRSKFLNWHNQFISDNYPLFSLSSSLSLICSNIEQMRFSSYDFQINCTAAIVAYNNSHLQFTCNLDLSYLLGYHEFYIVLCKHNFHASQMQLASCDSVPDRLFSYFYPTPPFNSADYHVFLVLKDKRFNIFSNTKYLFFFMHG